MFLVAIVYTALLLLFVAFRKNGDLVGQRIIKFGFIYFTAVMVIVGLMNYIQLDKVIL